MGLEDSSSNIKSKPLREILRSALWQQLSVSTDIRALPVLNTVPSETVIATCEEWKLVAEDGKALLLRSESSQLPVDVQDALVADGLHLLHLPPALKAAVTSAAGAKGKPVPTVVKPEDVSCFLREKASHAGQAVELELRCLQEGEGQRYDAVIHLLKFVLNNSLDNFSLLVGTPLMLLATGSKRTTATPPPPPAAPPAAPPATSAPRMSGPSTFVFGASDDSAFVFGTSNAQAGKLGADFLAGGGFSFLLGVAPATSDSTASPPAIFGEELKFWPSAKHDKLLPTSTGAFVHERVAKELQSAAASSKMRFLPDCKEQLKLRHLSYEDLLPHKETIHSMKLHRKEEWNISFWDLLAPHDKPLDQSLASRIKDLFGDWEVLKVGGLLGGPQFVPLSAA